MNNKNYGLGNKNRFLVDDSAEAGIDPRIARCHGLNVRTTREMAGRKGCIWIDESVEDAEVVAGKQNDAVLGTDDKDVKPLHKAMARCNGIEIVEETTEFEI